MLPTHGRDHGQAVVFPSPNTSSQEECALGPCYRPSAPVIFKLVQWEFATTPTRSDQEFEYVAQYLAAAQAFTAGLARDGRGLVYMIG